MNRVAFAWKLTSQSWFDHVERAHGSQRRQPGDQRAEQDPANNDQVVPSAASRRLLGLLAALVRCDSSLRPRPGEQANTEYRGRAEHRHDQKRERPEREAGSHAHLLGHRGEPVGDQWRGTGGGPTAEPGSWADDDAGYEQDQYQHEHERH